MLPAEGRGREAALALAKLEGWRQPVYAGCCPNCGRDFVEEDSGVNLRSNPPAHCILCEWEKDESTGPYDKARWFYVDTLSQE